MLGKNGRRVRRILKYILYVNRNLSYDLWSTYYICWSQNRPNNNNNHHHQCCVTVQRQCVSYLDSYDDYENQITVRKSSL